MKILKGILKGRNVLAPLHIRPISLRVKKACFDVLRDEIDGKCILDIFAGSGSLGIEALSCGAKEAVFVDMEKDAVSTIKSNVSNLRLISKTVIIRKDVFEAVNDFYAASSHFDVIFIDPPYYKELLRKTLKLLDAYDIVTNLGYIVGFCSTKDDIGENTKFDHIFDKNYGQTRLVIYRKRGYTQI